MPATPPKLHRHARGQFFVKWGGRTHYLGTDHQAAAELYGEQLRAWSRWRADKLARRQSAPRGTGVRLVRELVAEFLATKLANNGPRNERYNRANLARFTHAYGELPAGLIDAAKVEAVKAAMQSHDPPFAPRTINHDVGSIRDFLTWVMATHPGAMPAFDVRAVRKVRVRKAPPNAQPPAFVAAYIAALEAVDPRVGPWLRLQFLAGLRPVEVPRVVHQPPPTHWHRPELGRYVLAIDNKTERATDDFRYVVLTAEAQRALALCGRHWSRADSYGAAVARAWHGAPIGSGAVRAFKGGKPRDFPVEFLRDSAYQALLDSGTDFTVARALMGHVVPGSWGHYAHAPWHGWRKLMARLTLPHRSPPRAARPAAGRSPPAAPPPGPAAPPA